MEAKAYPKGKEIGEPMAGNPQRRNIPANIAPFSTQVEFLVG
jgi:hypothetical protein